MNKSKLFQNTRLVKAKPLHCELVDNHYINAYGDIVKRAFELRLTGLGAPTIAKQLNAEFEVPVTIRSGSFSHQFITKLLKDDATTGTLTLRDGSKVNNYFPAAISQDTFDKVNEKVLFTTGIIKNPSGSMNILKGITHCSACHSGVVSRTSNSRYRTVYCIKRGKGCTASSSLQAIQIVPLLLNYLLKDEWTQQTFNNIKRSKKLADEYNAQAESIIENLKSLKTKAVISQLEGDLVKINLYRDFHAQLAKGNKNNLLELIDLSTLEGKRSFSIILNAIFDDILIDFDNQRIIISHKHNSEIIALHTGYQDLAPEVWKVSGIKNILLKDSDKIPEKLLTLDGFSA